MADGRDQDHPIIDAPSSYELAEFTYRSAKDGEAEDYIDLVLERNGRRRRLRFFSPTNLMLEGSPTSSGLFILDIRGRGLESLRVEVGDYEGHGAPRFLARDVIEVGDGGGSTPS